MKTSARRLDSFRPLRAGVHTPSILKNRIWRDSRFAMDIIGHHTAEGFFDFPEALMVFLEQEQDEEAEAASEALEEAVTLLLTVNRFEQKEYRSYLESVWINRYLIMIAGLVERARRADGQLLCETERIYSEMKQYFRRAVQDGRHHEIQKQREQKLLLLQKELTEKRQEGVWRSRACDFQTIRKQERMETGGSTIFERERMSWEWQKKIFGHAKLPDYREIWRESAGPRNPALTGGREMISAVRQARKSFLWESVPQAEMHRTPGTTREERKSVGKEISAIRKMKPGVQESKDASLARFRLPGYREIWHQSVTQRRAAAAKEAIPYLESLDGAVRQELLSAAGLSEETYRRELSSMKEIRWKTVQKSFISVLKRRIKKAENFGAFADYQDDFRSGTESVPVLLYPDSRQETEDNVSVTRRKEENSTETMQSTINQIRVLFNRFWRENHETWTGKEPFSEEREQILRWAEKIPEDEAEALSDFLQSRILLGNREEHLKDGGAVLHTQETGQDIYLKIRKILETMSAAEWRQLEKTVLSQGSAKESALKNSEKDMLLHMPDLVSDEFLPWLNETANEAEIRFLLNLVNSGDPYRENTGSDEGKADEKNPGTFLEERKQETADWIAYMEPPLWDELVQQILVRPSGGEDKAEYWRECFTVSDMPEKQLSLKEFLGRNDSGRLMLKNHIIQRIYECDSPRQIEKLLVLAADGGSEAMKASVREWGNAGAAEQKNSDSEKTQLIEKITGLSREEKSAVKNQLLKIQKTLRGQVLQKNTVHAMSAVLLSAQQNEMEKADAGILSEQFYLWLQKEADDSDIAALETYVSGRYVGQKESESLPDTENENAEFEEQKQDLINWITYMEPSLWDEFAFMILRKDDEKESRKTENKEGSAEGSEKLSAAKRDRRNLMEYWIGSLAPSEGEAPVLEYSKYKNRTQAERLLLKNGLTEKIKKVKEPETVRALLNLAAENSDLLRSQREWLRTDDSERMGSGKSTEAAERRIRVLSYFDDLFHVMGAEESRTFWNTFHRDVYLRSGAKEKYGEISGENSAVRRANEKAGKTSENAGTNESLRADLQAPESGRFEESRFSYEEISFYRTLLHREEREMSGGEKEIFGSADNASDGGAAKQIQTGKTEFLSVGNSEYKENDGAVLLSDAGETVPEQGMPIYRHTGAGRAGQVPEVHGDIRDDVFIYRPASLVLTRPQPPGNTSLNPSALPTPDIERQIEKTVESHVKEELGDIRHITAKKAKMSMASEEYDKEIRGLRQQVKEQQNELENMKKIQTKLISTTSADRLTEEVLRQLERRLRLEKMRRGL